jgi:DNA polymerase III epsilon subunit-like protein
MRFVSDKQRRAVFYALTKPSRKKRIVAVDTETTGSGKKDQVIEVAAVSPQGTYHTYVKATVPISYYSFKVHGITTQDLSRAPPIREIRPELQEIINSSDQIVVHNAPFDIRMLRQAGLDVPEEKVRDTMTIAKQKGIYDGGDGRVSMDDMMTDLDVQIAQEDRHSAKGDAEALLECYERLKNRQGTRPPKGA